MSGETVYEILLYVSVAVLLATTALYLRSGRASFFHPATVYLGFHAVVFVIRPILKFYRGYDRLYGAYGFSPSWSDKITVLCGTNLGMIVFVATALFVANAVPRFRNSERELSSYIQPLLITCALCVVPAVWSLSFVYRVRAGTIENTMVMVAHTGISVNTSGNGYFHDAYVMLVTLVGMTAYIFRFRWPSLIPFVLFVFFTAGTGGRGPFIAAIFYMIALYLFYKRRSWLTMRTTIAVAAGAALFRYAGDDRGAALRALLGYYTPPDRFAVNNRFLESMDFANLEFFEYLVYTIPQRTKSYDYFAALLQIFTEPIPRALWHGKPVGFPIKLFDLWDYGTPIGMTFSLPGAGWFELGWAGIVILTAAFAWCYGSAYKRFMNSRQTPFAGMLYCAFLATSILAFRDGSVLTIAVQVLFYLTPVVLVGVLHGASNFQPAPARTRAVPDQRGVDVALRMSPKRRRQVRAATLAGHSLARVTVEEADRGIGWPSPDRAPQ